MIIYDQFGQPRKLEHLRAVSHLFKLKEKNGSNPWPVIEECFKVWASKEPNTWKSYLVRLDNIKQTRANKFASVEDTSDTATDGATLRYTLDIPEQVMFMVRCIYSPDELPMDKRFFEEFAKHFPTHVVPDKL